MRLTEEQIKKLMDDLKGLIQDVIVVSRLKLFLETYDFSEDKAVNFLPEHGTKMACPVCSSPGTFDGPNSFKWAFKDSIWYNIPTKSWACWDCYLK